MRKVYEAMSRSPFYQWFGTMAFGFVIGWWIGRAGFDPLSVIALGIIVLIYLICFARFIREARRER